MILHDILREVQLERYEVASLSLSLEFEPIDSQKENRMEEGGGGF